MNIYSDMKLAVMIGFALSLAVAGATLETERRRPDLERLFRPII